MNENSSLSRNKMWLQIKNLQRNKKFQWRKNVFNQFKWDYVESDNFFFCTHIQQLITSKEKIIIIIMWEFNSLFKKIIECNILCEKRWWTVLHDNSETKTLYPINEKKIYKQKKSNFKENKKSKIKRSPNRKEHYTVVV